MLAGAGVGWRRARQPSEARPPSLRTESPVQTERRWSFGTPLIFMISITNNYVVCFIVIATVFQENGSVTWFLPGVLTPFKKEISNIFRLEQAKLVYNKPHSLILIFSQYSQTKPI